MLIDNDNKYRGNLGRTLKLDEYDEVEKPFLDQLEELGWEVIKLQLQQKPADSLRSSFSEVVIKSKLIEALSKINPFLSASQIDEVQRKITTFQKASLLENNEQVLRYLLENTTVSINEQTGELSPTVRYLDFENIENNHFLAISQFKVSIPGKDYHFLPDIVLFVNGLPLVVVEAKSPNVKEPIAEAIDQLMRYSEQRDAFGEGNKELFFYNQILITTCRNIAKFGSISTKSEKHFFRWTDPYPLTLNDISENHKTPNDQRRLVAGMLNKKNLLDIVRVFTVFSTDDRGHKIKIVGRYQQFRAVKVTAERLINGKNASERGGIIWHTQGSGKTLTMMFLVREMKLRNELNTWKIVFITDRTQLEEQLSETGIGVGLKIKKANFISPKAIPDGRSLRELLSNDSSDLVLAMIHKFQENGDLSDIKIFPQLNESSKILIMTDEAHRSQYSLLGANLDRALPNATAIGFTGTPTQKTEARYKDYIDKYTMRQAIEDGVTLEIVYEGYTHNAEIEDAKQMDWQFSDVFSEYTLSERMKILGYATRDAYLDSEKTIQAKAESMVRHYVGNIYSGGFKAQIVANSRVAACRYKAAIDKAVKNLLSELEDNNPMMIDLESLGRLESAVIISGNHNDEAEIDKQFTKEEYHRKSIKRFKLPFGRKDDLDTTIDGNVGIIIVNEMLLTGFDAPIEQVMYLDRVIVAHNLLQAIARVNRIGSHGKDKGFIVDYVGVGHHLKKALDVYDEKEISEISSCISNGEKEIYDLQLKERKIFEFLNNKGLGDDLDDIDAFFDLFYDDKIRSEYISLYNDFTRCFNIVLPRKEALDSLESWKKFTKINALAKNHLRDENFSLKGIPHKLRKIADEYLISKGIEQQIAPISILADDFFSKVKKNRSRDKTRAAEAEHAIRDYLDIHIDDDPELFASFACALEEILESFKGNWKKIFEELEKLREKIVNQDKEETYGLDKKRQMPFFRVLKAELIGERILNENEISLLVNLTQNLFNLILVEIRLVGFWDNPPAQARLKAELHKLLLSKDYQRFENLFGKRNEILSRILELAKTNHWRIINES